MTIYKEMKYQKRLPEAEKLAEGKVGVYKWKVLSHGTHPCGYVSVPENHPFYGKNCSEIEGDIEVHGGLTFSGRMKDSDDYWFGWDYAHVGDHTYISGLLFDTEKSWTTQEIADECFDVIKQFWYYMEHYMDKEALQKLEAGLAFLEGIIGREEYVNDRMRFDIDLREKEYEFCKALDKDLVAAREALSSAGSTIRKYLKGTEEKERE